MCVFMANVPEMPRKDVSKHDPNLSSLSQMFSKKDLTIIRKMLIYHDLKSPYACTCMYVCFLRIGLIWNC